MPDILRPCSVICRLCEMMQSAIHGLPPNLYYRQVNCRQSILHAALVTSSSMPTEKCSSVCSPPAPMSPGQTHREFTNGNFSPLLLSGSLRGLPVKISYSPNPDTPAAHDPSARYHFSHGKIKNHLHASSRPGPAAPHRGRIWSLFSWPQPDFRS